MLKVKIEGVSSDGEVVNEVLEGSFVSAIAISRNEDCAESNAVSAGGMITPRDFVKHSIEVFRHNAEKIAGGDVGREWMMLVCAMRLIQKRLVELSEKTEKNQKGCLSTKVEFLIDDDTKKLLKELLK